MGGGGNYLKSIYLGSITSGQFSWRQLFRGNYQLSIILWDNSLSANCPGDIYMGQLPGQQFLGDELSGAQLPSLLL